MKKHLKKENITFAIAVLVIILATLGLTYIYVTGDGSTSPGYSILKKQKKSPAPTQQNNTGSSNQNSLINPSQNQNQPQLSAPKSQNTASLQASLNPSDQSILLTLVGPSGTYLIERCTNINSTDCSAKGPWVVAQSSAQISDSKGLKLVGETIPVYETERDYRITLLVNGEKVGSKEILIDRNLVVSGGGNINFPGAL